MTTPFRLHYAPDNASMIIRMALEEMGVPFETVLVNRAANAQRSAEYLALNPNGLIPVLETPDGPLFETGAILLWLADRHGQMAPVPDSADRGAVLKWLFFLSNTLHPALRMMFYADQYVGADTSAQTRLRHHMQGQIARNLDTLETLAATRPTWLGGDTLSILDVYLVPMLRWIALYPAPKGGAEWYRLSQWPHLHDIAARLEHSPAAATAITSEGLGPNPFTAPQYPNPPEGSAT